MMERMTMHYDQPDEPLRMGRWIERSHLLEDGTLLSLKAPVRAEECACGTYTGTNTFLQTTAKVLSKPFSVEDWTKWIEVRSLQPDLTYNVIGLCSEAGEVAEWFKKTQLRSKPSKLTDTDLLEELGDVLYYLTAIAHAKGWTLRDVMRMNVAKLEERERADGPDLLRDPD